MQISALVLYGYQNERRILSFRLGEVNIITGCSKTGKTAIGDIIDYCFGGEDCPIAEGFIREHVKWYALQLVHNGHFLFVARENPPFGHSSTNQCRVLIGSEKIPVDLAAETTPATSDDVEKILSDEIGIGEADFVPFESQKDNKVFLSIRHALYYCIQGQTDIDSKDHLFHHQTDPYIPQTIKMTMPYFLGAINEKNVSLENQKSALEKKMRTLQATIDEKNALKGEGFIRGSSLVAEAKNVGLLNKDCVLEKDDLQGVQALLLPISNACDAPSNQVPESNELDNLGDRYSADLEQISLLGSQIKEAQEYLSLFGDYSSEVGHQKNRLASIGLYENLVSAGDVCPFCHQTIDPAKANVQEEIKTALNALTNDLDNADSYKPKIEAFLAETTNKRQTIIEEAKSLKTQMLALKSQNEAIKKQHDFLINQAVVIGKIKLWLESVDDKSDGSEALEIEEINRQIEEIKKQLDEDDVKSKADYALDIISNSLTEWSKELTLEHSGSPFRYDFRKVTLVADADRSIPLPQIGSGENWVGCHLIVSFAFQDFFVTHQRPVPSFLFLDQLSKAFYPPEQMEEAIRENEQVKRLYDFIISRVARLGGKLQVIAVDHADLAASEFQNAVIERWWDKGEGDYLVPLSWSIRPKK